MNKKSEGDPEIKTLREQIEKISCAINVISPVTAMVGVDPVKRERVLSHSTPMSSQLGGNLLTSCYDRCDSAECVEMESAVESSPCEFGVVF
ncbi:hypothetical protein AHF37_09015 [Paragonimus kellicotti]|nr:hypothetical protein AHF37_09015 [Paragonimus kellicotti]